MVNKSIQLANVDVMKMGVITGICKKHDIDVRLITEEDYHKPLSMICGMQGDSKPLKDSKDVPGELALFCGFDAQLLETVLDEGKKLGLSIPYKAMLTVHNLSWSTAYLYKELVKEHESMKR